MRGQIGRLTLPCVLVLVGVLASASQGYAQAISQSEMDALSLDKLDEIVARVESQIGIVQATNGIPGTSGLGGAQTDGTGGDTDVVRPAAARTRAEPLCFADNFGAQTSPELLETYFEDVAGRLANGQANLTGFEALKAVNVEGSCVEPIPTMLTITRNELGAVSRAELAELIFHLETCWPDDGVTALDGGPLDMDASYNRARRLMRSLGVMQRNLREAVQWCE